MFVQFTHSGNKMPKDLKVPKGFSLGRAVFLFWVQFIDITDCHVAPFPVIIVKKQRQIFFKLQQQTIKECKMYYFMGFSMFTDICF
jgi:hypothetical protein